MFTPTMIPSMGNEQRDPAEVNDTSNKLIQGFLADGSPVTWKSSSRPREGYVAPGHVSSSTVDNDHVHYWVGNDGKPSHHEMRRGPKLFPGNQDEWEANKASYERLVREAESLALSSDWKVSSARFKELEAQMRATGPVQDRYARDAYWQSFRSAKSRFQDARSRFFDERKRQEAEAERTKERLVSRAESLAQSADLRAANQEMRQIGDAWKQAGRAERSAEDRLWKRLSDARIKLRSRTDEERKKREAGWAQAKTAKERLVSRARSLASSADLRAASQEMRQLSEEWKRAGRAERSDEDRLWRDFSAAKDQLFAKSKQERENREREAAQARSAKERLIAEMRSLQSSSDLKAARDRAQALSDAFYAAGSAGKEENQKLKDQFNSAKQALYDQVKRERERKQAEWEQRKREKLGNIEEAIRRTNDSISRLDMSIRNSYNRLQEQRMRSQPSFTHPHYWDIVRRQSEAQDRINSRIRDMELKQSSLQQKLIALGIKRSELLR
jgi:hypothetical protein